MRMKNFKEFVDYAVSGRMTRGDVSEIVKQLKIEKARIIKDIAKLSDDEERRKAFRELHDLSYRLYDAKICIEGEKKADDKLQFISMSAIANMVLCYDCY